MKNKIFLSVCCLVCIMHTAYSKGDFKIEPQNLVPDSSNSANSYFHINAGAMITVAGTIHYSDAWGFYIGPADSVYWFFNGSPAGTTYGVQTMNFSQQGVYSAIAYYAGTTYPSQKNIVLAFSGVTGIAGNSTTVFSVTVNKPEHTLVICNLPFGENISASLYTLAGMCVAKTEKDMNGGSCALSLNGINNGIYLLNLLSGGKMFSKKIFLGE